MPTYSESILRGFEAWPEVFRDSNGVIDFKIVEPWTRSSDETRYLEARFTTASELVDLLGPPPEIEEVTKFSASLYKYSKTVWVAVMNGYINSILLPAKREEPGDMPGWKFVFVSNLRPGIGG